MTRAPLKSSFDLKAPMKGAMLLLFKRGFRATWFPSSPVEIRVPFFLLFGFHKGTQKEKRAKGSYWET